MRAVAVFLALAADLAWSLAGSFWGFTLLAVLVLWVALNQANVTTGSKAYATEQRLNAAMPRIPNPQTTTGPAGNTSYPIGPTDDRIGAADGGSVTHPIWPGAAGTDHWHNLTGTGAGHGHLYGSLSTDFNALRDTCSNLVSAHNALVTKLEQAKVFQ